MILLSDDSSPDKKSDETSHDVDAEKFADSSQGTSSNKIQGLRSGEQLEFSFEAYNEDIFICGSKIQGNLISQIL